METVTILRNFSFTSITWHEVTKKMDIRPIRKLLNKHLHLSKYGNDVHQILFTYIADNHEDFRKEEMEYDVANKTLYLALRLDYEKVKDGTKEEVLILMQELYLASVFYYYGLGVRDFDFRRFYEDLKVIFTPNDEVL